MDLVRALEILRETPHDLERRNKFLGAVAVWLEPQCARFGSIADDVRQEAWIRIAETWPSCRATTWPSLRGWFVAILKSVAVHHWRKQRGGSDRELRSFDSPDLISSGARKRALQRCISEAPGLLVQQLPARWRNVARTMRISTTSAGRRRDLGLLLHRQLGTRAPSAKLGTFARRKAAQRGTHLLCLTAGVLAERERDLMMRSALLDIASRGSKSLPIQLKKSVP